MEVRIDTGEAWFDWQKYIIWEFLDQKELVGLKGSPANARKIFERLDGLKSEGKNIWLIPTEKQHSSKSPDLYFQQLEVWKDFLRY